MSAPTLNDFIAQIKKGGLARQNRFTVSIGGGTNTNGRLVELFCEQAELPSLSFSSAGVKTYGESREVVYDRNFEAITLSFLVDKNMEVKAYFDNWMNSVINPQSRNAEYYDSYVRIITISIQDTKDNDTYKSVLVEAYPKTIASISLDNNSRDVMKLQVSFNYKYHYNYPVSTSRGESDAKSQFGFDLPDPYKISRQLGNYLKGSISNAMPGADLYFSNFSQYQEKLNDSLSVTRALERQSFTTGTGSTLGI